MSPGGAVERDGRLIGRMRVLVLFAHPVETSFGAALHAKAVETLRRRGDDETRVLHVAEVLAGEH